MVKQTARLDGTEVSGGGIVKVTVEEAVTIQKAALIMLMQATPEQRLAHVSLPESYTTEHVRAVYQNLPEFDEESLKARDIIVRASRLLTAKMVRQTDARALVDAWRDEWHLEPEPEMDGATSQVYESLVNHVASALAAPASTVAPQQSRRSNHFNNAAIDKGTFPDHISSDGTAYHADGTILRPNVPASSVALGDEAEEFARRVVGTVFDNTAASHETLKRVMIERIADSVTPPSTAPAVIEGPSSTEYEAWLETRPDLTARFETDTFKRTTGYEIWRNSWLRLRELIEETRSSGASLAPPSTLARKAAEEIVGTVFDNTAASPETLKQAMLERVEQYFAERCFSAGGEKA